MSKAVLADPGSGGREAKILPDWFRAVATIPDEFGDQIDASDLSMHDKKGFHFRIGAALEWADAGHPRFVLTDSTAALLSLTRAPLLTPDLLPYRAFMIEVPSKFIPAQGLRDRMWIVLARLSDFVFLFAGSAIGADEPRGLMVVRADMTEEQCGDAATQMIVRLASNVVAFVTQHRECVTDRRPSNKHPELVMDVRPPVDIKVTSTLRAHAIALASAGTVGDVKRILAHVVRGHWKKQVVGPGRSERKLIFVAPYERGDESLGRVVDRATKIGEISP